MMTPVLYLFSLLKSLNSETQLLEACEWDENRLAYVKSEIEKCMSDYLSMQLVVDEDSLVEGFRASLLENITEKEALIKARLGHGQFRRDVEILEPICRVTGLDKKEFLIASHIKSWKESNNYERLDGSNGLLLSPHVDKLFDRHWISFTKDGKLIWKSEKVKLTLEKWGIKECKILKPLSSKQESYMNYHRKLLKD